MSYTVYIDTSIINLLTSQPARDPITRACQQLTRQWWHVQRKSDMCYSSAYVDSEIRAGEPLLAESRLRLSAQHTVFSEEAAVDTLGELLILGGGLTSKADVSAKHIACAAINHIDVLVTWNCVDIANPAKFRLMRMLMRLQDLRLPELACRIYACPNW